MERIENLKTEELKTLMDVTDSLRKKLIIEKRLYNTAKLDDKDLACIQLICEVLDTEIRARDKAMVVKMFGGAR